MKTLAYVGALILSFILGGVTTLVGFPRYQQPGPLQTGMTISPGDMQRSVGPLPETVVENYF